MPLRKEFLRPLHDVPFEKCRSLFIRLRNDKDPISRFLFKRFSTQLQQILNKNDDPRPPESLVKVLIDEIHGIINGPLIFDKQFLAQVTLTQEMEKYLNTRVKYMAQLNWLLLKTAFPAELGNIPKKKKKKGGWHFISAGIPSLGKRR